ncbi:scaffolding protein [Exiguobacterium sp. s22]|uniref:scaffolding protein n=1 Tax=Exiguobacterium sp. s22 TaxID=2751272 RepID=UPI001BE501FA|nr:scaffolding protein [Exiguobacterium sp. s22]
MEQQPQAQSLETPDTQATVESTQVPQAGEPAETPAPPKTFTQEELDGILKDRLDRERKKYADYDDKVAKLAELEKAEEERRLASLGEVERAQEEIAKKAQEAEELRQRLAAIEGEREEERKLAAFKSLASSAEYGLSADRIEAAIKLADMSQLQKTDAGYDANDVMKTLVDKYPFLTAQAAAQPIGKPLAQTQEVVADKRSLLEKLAEKARLTGRTEDKIAYAKAKRELGN